MIPQANITAWRTHAPWPDDAQVEQDLVLTRALIELFSDPEIAQEIALRGGTALQKLFIRPPCRYSEDIDLVQTQAAPIGPLLDGCRKKLDPWLGSPTRSRGPGSVTLIYRFQSEIAPVRPLRLKIEINTREHFTVLGLAARPFTASNPWCTAETQITTYEIDELLGTKLRALFQRRKGRDLFDLWLSPGEKPARPGARSRLLQPVHRSPRPTGLPRKVRTEHLRKGVRSGLSRRYPAAAPSRSRLRSAPGRETNPRITHRKTPGCPLARTAQKARRENSAQTRPKEINPDAAFRPRPFIWNSHQRTSRFFRSRDTVPALVQGPRPSCTYTFAEIFPKNQLPKSLGSHKFGFLKFSTSARRLYDARIYLWRATQRQPYPLSVAGDDRSQTTTENQNGGA